MSKYNRSKIMKDAWVRYRTIRFECERSVLTNFSKERFANCLSMAWIAAKAEFAEGQATTEQKITNLKDRIFHLECKDRWNSADYDRKEAMSHELRQLAA